MVQLWVRFGSASCDLMLSGAALAHMWFSWFWHGLFFLSCGSGLVQLWYSCVWRACIWFSFGADLMQFWCRLLGGGAGVIWAQLGFSFGAVVYGLTWFSFGSALVQLVVVIGSLDRL